MKIFLLIIGLVVATVGGVYLLFNSDLGKIGGLKSSLTYEPKTQGKVVVEIKDYAASLENISSIVVTIGNAEIYHPVQGWINLSSEPKDFDLINLKSSKNKAFLATAMVPIGSYNKINLMINKVLITESRTGRTIEAKLPSNELAINANIIVNDGTTNIVLDFVADQSLHEVAKSGYIFAPKVKVEAIRDVDVSAVGGDLKVSGGTTYFSETFGMDESGRIGIGLGITNTELEIINGAILIKEPGSPTTISASQAVTLAQREGLNPITSVKMIKYNNRWAWLVTGMKNSVLVNEYVDSETGIILKE